MSWLPTVLRALHYEPEVWAAYLLRQRFNELSFGSRAKPRYSGLPLRLAAYGRRLLKCIRFQSPGGFDRPADIFVLALTANQANSLITTVTHLRREGLSVHCVTGHDAASAPSAFGDGNCHRITLCLVDSMKVAFLMLLRAPIIWRQLANKDRRLRHWYFDAFLQCHIYLVYFEKALKSTNPRLILMSNDHNAPQRCLLALARVKGIKTAYVQHASVSRLFPALVFDYSLLDGQVAMDTYIDCNSNKPVTAPLPDRQHIFLTGQKKPVQRCCFREGTKVGFAINPLDDLRDVMQVVCAMTHAGYDLRLRWHPGMGLATVEEIRDACLVIPSVGLSDPLVETVGDFLSQVRILVAANSSIHLEAAVAGVMPVYFEVSAVSTRDYYGYVKNGVSAEAKDIDELWDLIDDVLKGRRTLNPHAVKAYSATFDTEWEGREGELAASIIKDLIDGAEPAKCWGYAGVMTSDGSQQLETAKSDYAPSRTHSGL